MTSYEHHPLGCMEVRRLWRLLQDEELHIIDSDMTIRK
jgi:hypothetical protein